MPTRHIHLHFPARKAGRLVARDQVPGSVPGADSAAHPPQAVAALVAALQQAIADRQNGTTFDAWKEGDHPRGEGGQFTSPAGFHQAKARFDNETATESVHNADRHKDVMRSVLLAARQQGYKSAGAPFQKQGKVHRIHHHADGHSLHIMEGWDDPGAARTRFIKIFHTPASSPAKTKDAGEWDESKHPRSEGGQFSSEQHAAAASNHESSAAAHTAQAQMAGAGPMVAMHQKAAQAHTEAAEAHGNAAKHLDAGTGLGEEFASQAHSKTYVAAGQSQKLDGLAGGNMMGAAHAHLKKIASDPKQPVGKRAQAAEQLTKMEKAANAVANSSHAAATGEPPLGEGAGPAGDKPTMATVKQSKAAVHQLLSTGHPFSIEELMKATGVQNRTTLMTALSDLKNPKYAGTLGALQIAKRPDGMYHVTQAPAGGFKAVGAAASGQPATPGAPAAAGGASPSTPEDVVDPLKVTQNTHPLSDYAPGQVLTAKGQSGKQYKVLGHNAEGHVVVQRSDGGLTHHMDPAELAKISTKGAAADTPSAAPPPAAASAAAAAGPTKNEVETAGAPPPKTTPAPSKVPPGKGNFKPSASPDHTAAVKAVQARVQAENAQVAALKDKAQNLKPLNLKPGGAQRPPKGQRGVWQLSTSVGRGGPTPEEMAKHNSVVSPTHASHPAKAGEIWQGSLTQPMHVHGYNHKGQPVVSVASAGHDKPFATTPFAEKKGMKKMGEFGGAKSGQALEFHRAVVGHMRRWRPSGSAAAASFAAPAQRDDSGVDVKHQPDGTVVPPQAPAEAKQAPFAHRMSVEQYRAGRAAETAPPPEPKAPPQEPMDMRSKLRKAMGSGPTLKPGDPKYKAKPGTPEFREHVKKLAEGASQTAEWKMLAQPHIKQAAHKIALKRDNEAFAAKKGK